MKTIAFYDTKSYDELYFNRYNSNYEIKYFEIKLNVDTAYLAIGCAAVVAFVNDSIDAATIDKLYELEVKVVALRSSGYNNVDVKAAYGKISIIRVPAYSPHAVAEHAMTLLLGLNRKIHKAYNRTRDFNFSLNGLVGFDMYKKTIEVIGTGKIGQVFIDICQGFKMNVIVYDTYPLKEKDIKYVEFDELLNKSDIISLHYPLTETTKYMINEKSISKMKDGVYIINTSRGGLVDSDALLHALKIGKVKGAGLDVYEEEANEALTNIAQIILENLNQYFNDLPLENEVCYLYKG